MGGGSLATSPDSLRAVLDSVFAGPAYVWDRPDDPLAVVRAWWGRVMEWFASLVELHPGAMRVMLYAAILALLTIVLHAIWVWVHTMRAAASRPPGDGATTAGSLRHDARWHRDEAERLAADGHFAEASHHRFLALVLDLETVQRLHYHPSKTPADYLREVSLPPGARSDLERLVRVLYGYLFARQPCGPAEYSAWRDLTVADRYARPR